MFHRLDSLGKKVLARKRLDRVEYLVYIYPEVCLMLI